MQPEPDASVLPLRRPTSPNLSLTCLEQLFLPPSITVIRPRHHRYAQQLCLMSRLQVMFNENLMLFIHLLHNSHEQGWVASGSFDWTVKLSDLSRASQVMMTPNPVMMLTPPDTSGAKASIYALAIDPQGHMIVSGSPEQALVLTPQRCLHTFTHHLLHPAYCTAHH